MERKMTLKTGGMTCPSCEKLIEGELGDLEGVRFVKADLATQSTEIVYDESKIGMRRILSVLTELGYPVR